MKVHRPTRWLRHDNGCISRLMRSALNSPACWLMFAVSSRASKMSNGSARGRRGRERLYFGSVLSGWRGTTAFQVRREENRADRYVPGSANRLQLPNRRNDQVTAARAAAASARMRSTIERKPLDR